MATFVPASGNVSFSAIKSAFSNQSSLSQYRSLRWYTNTTSYTAGWYGNFSSGTIKFSDFRNKGKDVQVTPGNFTITRAVAASYNNYIPVGAFNTIYITVVGGGGGVQGSPGNTGSAGSGGSAGGSSTYSTTTAAGGAAVLYPGSPSSGSTAPLLTWTAAANADKIGTTIYTVVGAGGAGGIGGTNYSYTYINGVQVAYDNGTKGQTGASGADGYIYISWS